MPDEPIRVCSVSGCGRPIGRAGARGLCPAHYRRLRLTGNVQPEKRVRSFGMSAEDRFWGKVDKAGGGCWLWTDRPNGNGYGSLNVDGRIVMAHRYAFELLVGPIPDGLVIDHLCRVRACVNPDHMEPVTTQENTRRGIVSEVQRARHAARRRERAHAG